MGFWSRLHASQQAKQIGAQQGGSFFGRLAQSTTSRRGTKETLEAYRESPWLHAVTKKIAEHVASVPWTLSVVKREGKVQRVPQIVSAQKIYREKMLRNFKQNQELQEIPDHPFLTMLNKANPKMTGLQARTTTSLLLDLKGECPWLLMMNNLNQPVEFWPLPPHWINAFPTEKRPWYEVSINGRQVRIPPENMLIQKYIDPADPYGRGTGPGDAMANEIDIDIALAETVKMGFQNKALPELLIGIKDAEVSDEELEKLAAKFKNRHRGTLKRGGVHFYAGEMSVDRLTQDFKEIQALEMRTWEREAFQSMFGIPPEIMGLMGSSNRATSHEAQKIFAREVVIPRLEHQRAEYQENLIPMYDPTGDSARLIVGYISPMPDDAEYNLEVASKNPSALTRGEWRMLSGHEHRGDVDDKHLMKMGEVLVDAYSEGVKPPPPPAPAPNPPSGDEPEGGGEDDDTSGADDDEKGHLPQLKGTKADTGGIVGEVMASLDPDFLVNEVQPEWAAAIEKWGQGTLEGLGVTGQGFNMLNPFVLEHLRLFSSTKITMVDAFTKERIREVLTEGIQNGEGFKELSKRIGGVFEEAKGYRAERIARTEVTNSANFASYTAQKQSGIVERRQWIPTRDADVREEHSVLGDPDHIVGINEPFQIAGFSAMYPGEFGVAEMDINCRCTTIAIVDPPPDWGDIDPAFGVAREVSAEVSKEIWSKAFEPAADKWEAKAIKAFRRGFTKQEKAVQDALKRFLG